MPIAMIDDLIRTPIENAIPGIKVRFDTPSLYWNRDAGSVDLQLSNVVFSRAEPSSSGGTVVLAQSPYVGLAISGLDLIAGRVRPVRLDLIGPHLDLKWSGENVARRLRGEAIGPEGASVSEGESGEKPAILGLLQALLGSGEIQGPLARMEKVSIRDGDIELEEIITGEYWHLPGAQLQFSRGEDGLQLDLDLRLVTEAQDARIQVYSIPVEERPLIDGEEQGAEKGSGFLRFIFDELNPALLARSVDLGGLLQTIDLPVFGSVDVAFDRDGVAQWATFDLGGSAGRLNLPALFEKSPDVDQIEVAGRYKHATRTLRLDRFLASLAGGQLSADGVLRLDTEIGKPDVRMFLDVSNMSIRDVLKYWPSRVAPNARNWVDLHLPMAHVEDARFQLAVDADDWGKKPLPDGAIRIDVEFTDATAHYKRPLPPIIGTSGTAVILSDQVDIQVVGGQAGDVPITSARLLIENSGRGETALAHADVRAQSDAGALMRFIDNAPLGYPTRFGISPDDITGQATTHAKFTFPPRKGTTFADVQLEIEVSTRNLAFPDVLRDGGLSDGELNLHIEKTGLSAHGPIRLKGVPLELHWSQSFTAQEDGQPRSSFLLSGNVNAAHLETFGLPAEGRVDGTARINMTVRSDGKNLRDADVVVDLYETGVTSPRLNWFKPARTPGKVAFQMKWERDRFWIDHLTARTEEFSLGGSFLFDRETSALREAYVSELKSAGHDLSLVASLGNEGQFELNVDAQRLDLSFFLDDLMGGEGTGYVPEAVILINAKNATARNGVILSDLVMDAWNAGGYWTTADLRGRFADSGSAPGSSDFRLILSGTFEKRNLEITSSDAGRLALGLGLFRNGSGGSLIASAELNGRGMPSASSGHVRIDDFRIVKSSVLVSALEAEAAGYGIDDMIDNNGMQFDEMELPFTINRGVIDVNDAFAYGKSIGFTMEGQLDQGMAQINLNGLVIPAYSLNTLLGKLPLVGGLLGGRDGGLFALSYRVQGSRAAPDISFNPLSAIAPGFLRNLFKGRRGTIDVPSEPEQPSNQPDASNEPS